jgi:hypothetical protein
MGIWSISKRLFIVIYNIVKLKYLGFSITAKSPIVADYSNRIEKKGRII